MRSLFSNALETMPDSQKMLCMSGLVCGLVYISADGAVQFRHRPVQVYSFAKGRAPYIGGIRSVVDIDRSYTDISCKAN